MADGETGQAEEAYLEAARAFLRLGGTHFLFETQADFAPLKPAIREIAAKCPDAFVAVSFAVSQDGYSQRGILPRTDRAGAFLPGGTHGRAELRVRAGTHGRIDAPPARNGQTADGHAQRGVPSQVGGRTFFQDNAAYFGEKLAALAAKGRWVVGGLLRDHAGGAYPPDVAWRRQTRTARVQAPRRRKC